MRRTLVTLEGEIPLEHLAEKLTTSDLADIILLKAHRRAKDDRIERDINILGNDVIDYVNERRRGFKVLRSLPNYWEDVNKNIDGLIELVRAGKDGLRRKFIRTEYEAIEHLAKANFLEIKGEGYQEQILTATEKLVEFINSRMSEDETWDYGTVNVDLRNALVEELYPKPTKQKA